MRRFFRTVTMLLICGAMIVPSIDAQSRGRNNNPQKTSPAQTRPSTVSRPGNSGQSNSRPGNSGQGKNSSRPGNQPGNSSKPTLPSNNNSRPNTPPTNNSRPDLPHGGAPVGPIGSQRPNYQPQPPHNYRPPMRPNNPPISYNWYRPTPPPSWRPSPTWRTFHSILGITFGTAITQSIISLVNRGYVASPYGNNAVQVTNVPMLGMIWPNAVLFYNNGGLCGSRFIYSTGFYDMTRYNSVYASLVSTYGSPYSVQNTASGIEANWWGPGNQFITLSFGPAYLSSGIVNYYTTLNFGI